MASPHIPAPPPRGGPRRGNQPASKTPWIWVASFGAGVVLGALGYEWIPGVTVSFDYVLTVLLG